jgi:hypothetical protein
MSDFFDTEFDYWGVSRNTKDIFMSSGAISSLLDFERVLDEVDIYAFKNWELGELVSGPQVNKYTVSCVFMWPEKKMPDPRGGKRLLPFDCSVKYKKTSIRIPIKIDSPDDYEPGTKKARVIKQPVWFVEIEMPKALMSDIRTGAVELEGESVDLDDLNQSYEQDLAQDEFVQDQGQGITDLGMPQADAPPAPASGGLGL